MAWHVITASVATQAHRIVIKVIDAMAGILESGVGGAAMIGSDCALSLQVIDLHRHCMLTIMRFGLMERLKALSMVAIITWTSREACGRISAALARHCGGAAPPDVTTDMLLAIIAMPDFVDGIDRAERDFTEVTCPRTHPDLALLLMWDRSCFLYWLRICIRAFWLSQV